LIQQISPCEIFCTTAVKRLGLSLRLPFEEVLRPSWGGLVVPTMRSMLARIFSPLRRAAEGQPKPGPWRLPLSGGWLSADAGQYFNWWQSSFSPTGGARSAVLV
jgi:hypothetical protein